MTTYYRYEDSCGASPWIRELESVRYTKHGMWVDDFGVERFILLGARKMFAHKTRIEAIKSFLSRRFSQRKILSHQIDRCETSIRAGKLILAKMEEQ